VYIRQIGRTIGAMAHVTSAVILAAGLGTRMLPATKAVPKELLPVVDRPLIQYAVEEAVAAGIRDIIIVIGPGKEAIREHFGTATRADDHARASGDPRLRAICEGPANLANFTFVNQDEPRGIAHAVSCARAWLEGRPFALVFPDDLIVGTPPCLAQLTAVYSGEGSILAVQEVVEADVPQYGIVDPLDGVDANPLRLRGIVEKPAVEAAPSRLGVVGRYVLGATIFSHIDRTPPGKNGEVQITDALARQIDAGEAVCAFRYSGTRYDTGRPLGYLCANVGLGLRDPEIGPALRAYLESQIGGPH
jgi:UTP--glucose-1-phosphate uridylyltransferase